VEAQHEAEVSVRTPDLSELERIVGAAEASATAASPDGRSALRETRQKAAAILAEALPQLDRGELDRLRREHDVELRRLTDEAKRRALEGAADAARRLDAIVAAERAALEALPVDPFGAGSELLLEVDFIRSWPTPENLIDSHQEPGLNWAKYMVDSDDPGLGVFHEKVSFYIVWQNPRDTAVLVDVLVRLAANGRCQCRAEWGGVGSWFWDDSRSKLDISARLTLWGLWAEPAPLFLVDSVPVESVIATGGFFGDSSGAEIEAAPAVATTLFPVPARASILIEASLAVDYELDAGAVDVDFKSDYLSVGCPYAVVTVPPETMVSG
jgi:hypothetical protein